MKVLLAGMIGAAVAAAAWLGLEHVTQMNLGWLSCAVGIVTGYCVHRAAGPNAGGSFIRGALSVIIALVAIVGGRQVFVKVLEANAGAPSPETHVAPVMSEPKAVVAQADDAEEPKEPMPQPTRIPGQRHLSVGTIGSPKASIKSSLSEWDMLWMSLAALAAYVIGKGRDEGKGSDEVLPTNASEEPQSEPTSPATKD